MATHPWLNLKDEVYLVCNQAFIPDRWRLPVCIPNWPWKMRLTQCATILRMGFSQCAVGPSSLLRDEVYLVCSGPSSLTGPRKMRFTQCAASPSSILRMRLSQSAVGPSSITGPERWCSPSVYRALHSPRVKFNKCAVSSRDEIIIFFLK